MATHEVEVGKKQEAKQECFLCVLDLHPTCSVKQLEGRILTAHERIFNGEKTPVVILDTGTARVEVHLIDLYYRKFVKELRDRGTSIQNLVLRLYHLPNPPIIGEYNGQPRHIYHTNSYTLAVVEPDVLLNITDLNHAEYCSRQYLLYHLAPSTTSAAAIRGNLVHHCFKELLKEHDRGELMNSHASKGQETPLARLHRHFKQALEQYRIEMALANVTVEEMQADVTPHLESLATWYQNQSATLWDMPTTSTRTQLAREGAESHQGENIVRAETFLLAPEIGLRGRLDLLWQQTNRQSLLELKTGGDSGNLPKSNHRWQVHGYHALLAVRRDPRMKKARGTLLYSGTPGEAQSFGIEPTIRDIQRVNETRNILVLSHITGIPSPPPGPSRCTKCTMLDQCTQVSSLLGWQPPEPDAHEQSQHEKDLYASEEDRTFFATFYQLLRMEEREAERLQAMLWKTTVADRIEAGTAISDLQTLGKAEPTGQGEWEQEFLCENTSELREGDEILLSDGDPITGEVVTGNIKSISAERVRVWSPELIAHPRLIDRYGSNIVHVRTVQNLLRWLQADTHLRELVAGKLRPRFSKMRAVRREDFNDEQNLAVERALQMQDYLLVQGPPGTGKTSVIAEIVKCLCRQGQRVLLAAFTNQAVDNMLKRLDSEGFHDYIRLGHDLSTHADVQGRLLKNLVGHQASSISSNVYKSQDAQEPDLRELLRKTPVVASTTATWSSEKYAAPSSGETAHIREDSPLQFDVAIIDEASQLTIPAILGALRLAKRFILVGDEKQLPPLVLSKEAAEQGLADSLFSNLKRLDADYTKEHSIANSACVSLRVQYRMNRWISNFSSKVFYEDKLEAAPAVAKRVLEVTTHSSRSSHEADVMMQALQPAYPMVFLDVRGGGGSGGSGEAVYEGPKSSNAEARAVRKVVHGLLIRGILEKDIGIIAPYRAQVANLRRHLFVDDITSDWQALSSNTPMSIDTVDRFQGGERMVIIMSFATTKTPESPLREFLTNPHRLNVALTRAQRKLILVGCAPALEALPYFERLLKYCKSMNMVLPVN
ncbi:MAG: DEAD/DEAH box helicase [Ktedonobacteraceae bacterium]